MATFKKVLKGSWLGKQYAMMEGKENGGFAETPSSKRTRVKEGLSERKVNTMDPNLRPSLRRNTSVTQSVRDVVGSFRQKLKKTTKQRKRLQDSPCTPGFKKKNQTNKRTPTRRGGYREVKMYSPFSFETPDRSHYAGTRREPIKWFDYETPTKLRKEVEDLTSNMQAMMALTPGTLKSRASRRSLMNSPTTPSSNKKGNQTRRQVPTTVL